MQLTFHLAQVAFESRLLAILVARITFQKKQTRKLVFKTNVSGKSWEFCTEREKHLFEQNQKGYWKRTELTCNVYHIHHTLPVVNVRPDLQTDKANDWEAKLPCQACPLPLCIYQPVWAFSSIYFLFLHFVGIHDVSGTGKIARHLSSFVLIAGKGRVSHTTNVLKKYGHVKGQELSFVMGRT